MQPAPPPKIAIDKAARRLTLEVGGAPQRRYAIAIGRNTGAHKSIEGDEATPLGEYYVCAKNPRSKFFLSLCVSYPNAADAERGLRAGLITAEEHAEILAANRERRMPPQHSAWEARSTCTARRPARRGRHARLHRAQQCGHPGTVRPGAARRRGLDPAMNRRKSAPLIYAVSETAATIELPGAVDIAAQRRIWWLADRFRSYPGAREVVPGMLNLTVDLDPEAAAVETLQRDLEAAWNESGTAVPSSRRMRFRSTMAVPPVRT